LEFRLGYATPTRFGLKEYLGSKGVSVSDMIETGLLVAGDDIPVPYDRFRDRVIIPIHDQRGRVIAFGGRALRNDVQPKYLNSPETSLFHKGSVVFNFHRAREAAHKVGSVVAVEGYMDAIAIYQAGIKSVVATMGTAFGEEQIATLWRLSSEPVVCFDSDNAGVNAAFRSIDRILPQLAVGKSFRFVFMSEEKDPDDLIRERGVEAFRDVLSKSRPIWDVLWDRETANVDVRTPDAQAALERKLGALIRTIKDNAVQSAYSRACRLRLADLFWQAIKGSKAKKEINRKGEASKLLHSELKIERDGKRHGLQKVLLGLLVHHPEFLDEKQDTILRLKFAPELDRFCSALYQLLVRLETLSVLQIYENLGDEFYEVLQDIHGREDGRRWGHRLFFRFPILTRDPSPDFISRCIDHFARIIHLAELDDDIEYIKSTASDSEEDEPMVERLLHLIRERQSEHKAIEDQGALLADEAATYKPVWATGDGSMQVYRRAARQSCGF
jgi:DNA primase